MFDGDGWRGLWRRASLVPGSFEAFAQLVALAASLPASLVAAALILERSSEVLAWTAALALVAWGIAVPIYLRRRIHYTLNTVANLLEALRESDFSLRARSLYDAGPMRDITLEVNTLSEILREQRLGALEATTLLRRVIDALDVAVFAFDGDDLLRLVNRAGARLLGRPAGDLLGSSARSLDLDEFLEGRDWRLVERAFPHRAARWDVRRSGFRKDGLPVRLIVLSDLSQPLREEERQAWKRLIRVLGHELNNSLAPIRSMADTLLRLLDREPRPADWDDDARASLQVISTRSESLSRFLTAYSRLARLPQPTRRPVDAGAVVRQAATLEQRVPVEVVSGPSAILWADPDQLSQAFINLLRNAAEASLETGEGVRVGWRLRNPREGQGPQVELWVQDSGPGLANPDNLFVPFYTTKPQGSGIGLVLARQIAEAHGGTVSLENRPTGGCLARLRLQGGLVPEEGSEPGGGEPEDGQGGPPGRLMARRVSS